jgi:ribosomal protein S12 methylthiotransferase accessory factor YcaO
MAISCQTDGSRVFFGSAAHLNPRTAISRAISEMSQLMLRQSIPAHTDPKRIPPQERDLVHWILTQNIEHHSHLSPLHGETKTLSDYPSMASDNFLTDIQTCVGRLTHQGARVLVVNLSRPDINHSTVKLISPELRHFWSRLAPGRLYDVPVKLNWVNKCLPESEMNTIPYFV